MSDPTLLYGALPEEGVAAAITASNARESAFFRARENDDARVAVSDCRPVYCMHCDKPACRACETADTAYCGNCGTPGGMHDGDWHGVEGGERCHRAECRRCRTPIRAPDDCNCAGCAATRGLGPSLHEELRLDHPLDCGDACQP